MYEIHFTDGTGIKGLTKKCDVRMNIAIQLKAGRKVDKVMHGDFDITPYALHGFPV